MNNTNSIFSGKMLKDYIINLASNKSLQDSRSRNFEDYSNICNLIISNIIFGDINNCKNNEVISKLREDILSNQISPETAYRYCWALKCIHTFLLDNSFKNIDNSTDRLTKIDDIFNQFFTAYWQDNVDDKIAIDFLCNCKCFKQVNNFHKGKFNLRSVQILEFHNSVKAYREGKNKIRGNIQITDAAVGSGKTQPIFDFIAWHILSNPDKKTLDVITTFRIALDYQHANDLIEALTYYNLFRDRDYTLYIVNSAADAQSKLGKKSNEFPGKHVVFIYCDDSLFGNKNNLNAWASNYKRFNAYKFQNDVDFGIAYLDEAQTYDNASDQLKIFGFGANNINSNYTIENAINDSKYQGGHLANLFPVVSLGSGTCRPYQKNIANDNLYNAYSICCPLNVSIKKKWTVGPCVNTILNEIPYGNTELSIDYPRVIKEVLNHEIEICNNEKFQKPYILACMQGIPTISYILDSKLLKDDIGITHHSITVHSLSNTANDEGDITEHQCSIDNKIVSVNYAKKFTSLLGKSLNQISDEDKQIIKDDLHILTDDTPVIVYQIDMLSVGINVSAFNSIIITSKNEEKIVQQIGRPIRNYVLNVSGKKMSKINDGHANIYAVGNKADDIKILLQAMYNAGLNGETISFGQHIELVSPAESPESDDMQIVSEDNPWVDIDPNSTNPLVKQIFAWPKEFKIMSNKHDVISDHINSIYMAKDSYKAFSILRKIMQFNSAIKLHNSVSEHKFEIKTGKKENIRKTIANASKKSLESFKATLESVMNNFYNDCTRSEIDLEFAKSYPIDFMYSRYIYYLTNCTEEEKQEISKILVDNGCNINKII